MSATPTIKQVIEAIGAPDAAEKWAKNLSRWSYLYACRRPEITIELIDGIHKRRRRSLGMAKQVPEDWASLLWTENTSITAGGDREQAELDRVLGSDFSERFASDIEVTFAKGTGALEILLDDLTVNAATGALVVGASGELDIAYIPAECIVPLSWHRGEIEEVAFVSWHKGHVDVREHRGNGRRRIITNRRFSCQDTAGIGKLTETDIPEGVMPIMELVDSPKLFAILAPAIANNIDPESPFGISVFANAEDAIEGVDMAFDNFLEDIHLGGKMVFIPDTMLRKDKTTGKPVAPQQERRNLFVAMDNATGADNAKIHEHNPDLRISDNKLAVETMLGLVSMRCGMGEGRYVFTGSGVKTATEVISENSDLYRNRKKHLVRLAATMSKFASAILWASNVFLGTPLDPSVEIAVNSDDSVIEDDESKAARGREEVAAGVLSERSYLIKYKGYTEDEADKEIAAIKAGRSATPLFS